MGSLFGFLGKWASLSPADKRDKYSSFACHELNLFVYFKVGGRVGAWCGGGGCSAAARRCLNSVLRVVGWWDRPPLRTPPPF